MKQQIEDPSSSCFERIILLLMNDSENPLSQQSQNLAANEYKIYDINLFKSQLKVFQTEVQQPQQSDDNIHIDDQSLSLDGHLPISHQEGRKDINNFSINHSFDGITEETLPHQKNLIVKKESKGDINAQQLNHNIVVAIPNEKPSVDNQQDWEGLPRKCSNPMFEVIKPNAQSQLVRQLEILTRQRSRYKQASYFSKKERSVEVKSIEDLFESYKNKSPNNERPDQYSSIVTSPKHQINKKEKIPNQNEKNDCQLFQITNGKIEQNCLHKQQKSRNLNNEEFVPEKWFIGKQPKIRKANLSPKRFAVHKYLRTEDKDQYRCQLSRSIFTGQAPLKQQYFKQNKLREEYLQSAKKRSQNIHKELEKLKYPPKFSQSQHRSSSRKKIFTLQSSPSTHKPDFPFTPKTTKHSNERSKLYQKNFSSKVDKDRSGSNKKDNTVNFQYVRHSLVNTRIHIFNSKCRSKEKADDKSGSKVKNFKKISPKHTSPNMNKSPCKLDMFYDLNVMKMSYQTRQWFQKYEKQILLQCQKIYSNQLITRYIQESEIKVRLGQFIKGMIEPKRWILLMVDGVYARLKDRYLPC